VTPVELWLDLLHESGDSRHASTIANDFLRRLPSYDDPSRRDETLAAVQALVATGEMSPRDATARARVVIDALAPTLGASPVMSRAMLAAAYAQLTDDEATLREIIAAYAEPLPALDLAASVKAAQWVPRMARGLGKALVLTGDLTRGLPLLEQASRACDIGSDVDGYIHGLYWLGFAREKNGDAAGACEAYGRVLGYWGHVKPRSVTAEKARARMKVLGCRD
jgi:hypothetical protein